MKIIPPLARGRGAFTLLEIMLVVMIIALLAGAAIYMMGGNVETARLVRLKTDLTTISTQVKSYSILAGNYPTTEQGLKALVTRPEGAKQWQQMMQQIPVDPWQHEYLYVCPGKHNPDTFDISSKGPDGKADTPDDVGNW